MPKIMRRAVMTGSKLSVDTYALNYFSHKIFFSGREKISERHYLFNLSNSLHLKSSVTKLVSLPISQAPASFKNKLSYVNQLSLDKSGKPIKRAKTVKRISVKFLSKQFSTKGFSLTKTSHLINKIFRNKSRSITHFRGVLNAVKELSVYRSRLANLHSPLAYHNSNKLLPLPTVGSKTVYINTRNSTLPKTTQSLLVNEFSHQLVTQYLTLCLSG
jgi:hypothetical protein